MKLGFIVLLFGLVVVNPVLGQIQIATPVDSTVSPLDRQVVTVKSTPGALVELLINDVVVRTDTVRIDGLLDFINVPVPVGDVSIEARLLKGHGTSGGTAKRWMHILGSPAFIVLDIAHRSLFADGKSSTQGTVTVFDQWKYRIPDNIVVTLDADSGLIKADDLDKEKRGSQIGIHDGIGRFEYIAGSYSGTAIIKAMVDTLQTSLTIDMSTPYEKFIMVGLASGTGQLADAKANDSVLSSSKSYPDGFTTDGRIAVYARGTIFEKYRLTASFDNDRRNASRFYRDLDPDYLYSIYGDNSMLVYDAQTTRSLYARLERNKSYALFGDYQTDVSKQEFTAYRRTLYGLKVGHEDQRLQITGFGSLTDRKVVQLEIRGTGLSGFYNLGYLNVTPGSEKVRMETRDRFHSEILLKQTDQYRFSDYEIDYAQGTLFFKQPVPSVDVQGNPVYIVVSFEAFDDRKKSYVAGGRIEHELIDNLKLGINGIVEEQHPTNYSLLGGDVSYSFNQRSTLSGEIARSDQNAGSGLAYKMETVFSPIPELSVNGYYRRVEKEFSNITQAGSGRELGTEKYGAGGSYQFNAGTKLTTDYYHSFQDALTGGVDIQSISGSVDHKIASNMSGMVRLEDFRYDGPARDTSNRRLSTQSLLASARLNYRPIEKLTFAIQHDRNLGADQDITKPNGTMIFGEYQIAKPVSIQAHQKFFEDGSSLSSVGVNSTPVDGTTLYGKYEIGNAIGQHRNLLSIGLKNKIKLLYDITANFGIERAKSLERRLGETPTEDHVAYSGALEYLPERPIKASVKAEYGEDNLARKSNYFAGVDFRLLQDVSFIAKGYLSFDDSRKSLGYQNRSHLIFGAAYRPVVTNWLNIIGKFEWKEDDNHYLAPFNEYHAAIVSVHAFVEPVHRFEVGGKVAYKRGNERSIDFNFNSHTYFYLIDLRYNLSKRFDVGGEYRLMRQQEANDWLIGYHAEVGFIAINNLRIAVGYNFKGYKERDLVDYSLWTKGPFIRMSFKFDESLLGLK